MCRNERGHVSIPTAKQNCGAAVIGLRQAQSTVFLRHLNSKRADLCETFEIFRRNFTRTIDLVRIYLFAQIVLQLAQKIFAGGAILCALRGVRVNPFEIIASDEEITGETATVLERIARGFGQFERFALALRHL